MNSKIMETLETLEEKIENIKWLIRIPFSGGRNEISHGVSTIRRTSGMLGKGFHKGTAFENRMRKSWGVNAAQRTV